MKYVLLHNGLAGARAWDASTPEQLAGGFESLFQLLDSQDAYHELSEEDLEQTRGESAQLALLREALDAGEVPDHLRCMAEEQLREQAAADEHLERYATEVALSRDARSGDLEALVRLLVLRRAEAGEQWEVLAVEDSAALPVSHGTALYDLLCPPTESRR